MGYHWYDLIGNVGAAMVMLSLAYDFNLSAFIVECSWTAISIFGIIRAVRVAQT